MEVTLLKAIKTLAVFLLLMTGLGLLALGFVPVEWVQSLANRLAPDGNVESLGTWFPAVAARLRLAGIVLTGLAILAVRFRTPVAQTLGAFRAGLARQLADGWRAVVGLPAADGKVLGWGLLVIMLVGGGLRVWMMSLPISTDEAQTVVAYASRPLPVTVSLYTTSNNHVFHSVIIKPLMQLVGTQVWAARMPALLAGIGIIPLVFFFVRGLAGSHLALLCAAYCAVDPRLLQYSALARGYTLEISLVLLAGISLGYWAKAGSFGIEFVGVFSILCALALWTQPSILYAVLGLFIWLFVAASRSRRFWSASKILSAAGLVTGFLTAVLYLPIFLVSGPRELAPSEGYVGFTLMESVRFAYVEFPPMVARYWNPGIPDAGLVTAAALAVLGLYFGLRHRKAWTVPVLAVLVVPLVMIPLQTLGPTLARLLRLFTYMAPFIAIPICSGLVMGAESIKEARHRATAVLLTAGLVLGVRGLSTDWASLRGDHTELAALSEGHALTDRIYRELAPGVHVKSPNRLSWPLRFHFLADGQSQQPFLRPIRPDFQGRILVVVHEPMQTLEAALDRLRGLSEVSAPVEVQRIERFGNATLYQLIAG